MKTPLDILNEFAFEVEEIVKDELTKIGLPEKYPSSQPVKLTNSVKTALITNTTINFTAPRL